LQRDPRTRTNHPRSGSTTPSPLAPKNNFKKMYIFFFLFTRIFSERYVGAHCSTNSALGRGDTKTHSPGAPRSHNCAFWLGAFCAS
jgi:hypothetical protein